MKQTASKMPTGKEPGQVVNEEGANQQLTTEPEQTPAEAPRKAKAAMLTTKVGRMVHPFVMKDDGEPLAFDRGVVTPVAEVDSWISCQVAAGKLLEV